MARVLELFILPPLAIARVGGCDTPLDAFDWVTDHSVHGGHCTVIRPTTTLEVLADGSLRAHVPNEIRFRDGALLRPVAPFIELWAKVQRIDTDGQAVVSEEPVNSSLLAELGAQPGSVHFSVTMANRKAERRTTSQECGYTARVEMQGDDHEPKQLLAFSPHTPGTVPLVSHERPIPLGTVQMIRPTPRRSMGVDLSVVRLRFTPPRGEVYGTPTSITAMASTVPPGPPQTRLVGRLHEMVKPENRILNEDTPWTTYVWNAPDQVDPQPSDSYDGAHDGTFVSWGVVDDTSDGLIEAQLVAGGERFTAVARLFSSCPDYSPDQRTFVSFLDDLADRDEPPADVAGDLAAAEREVGDLFQRVFETVSAINLDAARWFAINENLSAGSMPQVPGWPQLDQRSMTGADTPYADNIPDLLSQDTVSDTSVSVAHDRLPYTMAARAVHTPLTDLDTLLAFLQADPARVRRLLRPPFGRFAQLPEQPAAEPSRSFRDPRLLVDTMQDMRMPPYMRDSDENPLSLTWNQYELVTALLDLFESGGADGQPIGPGRRAVAQLAERLQPAPATTEQPDA